MGGKTGECVLYLGHKEWRRESWGSVFSVTHRTGEVLGECVQCGAQGLWKYVSRIHSLGREDVRSKGKANGNQLINLFLPLVFVSPVTPAPHGSLSSHPSMNISTYFV